jgi:hypothetical protein
VRFLAHGAASPEHAQPDEQQLRHVDGPGQRAVKEPHQRRNENEPGDGGKQEHAGRELELGKALEHEV